MWVRLADEDMAAAKKAAARKFWRTFLGIFAACYVFAILFLRNFKSAYVAEAGPLYRWLIGPTLVGTVVGASFAFFLFPPGSNPDVHYVCPACGALSTVHHTHHTREPCRARAEPRQSRSPSSGGSSEQVQDCTVTLPDAAGRLAAGERALR